MKDLCLDFFIEAFKQIVLRFPLRKSIMKDLIAISPEKALAAPVETIVPIFRHFPNLVSDAELQTIDTEWREFRNLNDEIEASFKSSDNAEEFWGMVSQLKSGDNTQKFPILCQFIFHILSLPDSPANVERLFSSVILLKTKQRNRLSTSSIVGLLHTKEYLGKADG